LGLGGYNVAWDDIGGIISVYLRILWTDISALFLIHNYTLLQVRVVMKSEMKSEMNLWDLVHDLSYNRNDWRRRNKDAAIHPKFTKDIFVGSPCAKFEVTKGRTRGGILFGLVIAEKYSVWGESRPIPVPKRRGAAGDTSLRRPQTSKAAAFSGRVGCPPGSWERGAGNHWQSSPRRP